MYQKHCPIMFLLFLLSIIFSFQNVGRPVSDVPSRLPSSLNVNHHLNSIFHFDIRLVFQRRYGNLERFKRWRNLLALWSNRRGYDFICAYKCPVHRLEFLKHVHDLFFSVHAGGLLGAGISP